jgi:hypothetical protein
VANALEEAVTPSADSRNFRHSSADWLLVFYPKPGFGRLHCDKYDGRWPTVKLIELLRKYTAGEILARIYDEGDAEGRI